MESKTWDLVTAQETTNALEVFTAGNIEKIIGGIENEVRSIITDATTAQGRKEIASTAYKVSRTKTVFDSLGKELVAEWKIKAKAVDSERKVVRDRLDSLRDEVRLPLTEWENAEKKRIEKEKLLKEIKEAHESALLDDEIFEKNKALEKRAAELEQKEADRLARQKAEDDEKARIEREERLKREAAEEEKRKSEEKILNLRLSEERAKREAKEADQRRINDLKAQEERLIREQKEKEEKQSKKKLRLSERRPI